MEADGMHRRGRPQKGSMRSSSASRRKDPRHVYERAMTTTHAWNNETPCQQLPQDVTFKSDNFEGEVSPCFETPEVTLGRVGLSYVHRREAMKAHDWRPTPVPQIHFPQCKQGAAPCTMSDCWPLTSHDAEDGRMLIDAAEE